MADKTHIEWTDATWNPITGCSVVSPGCTNCYAMKLAGTRLKHHPSRAGLTVGTKAGPVWNGEVRFNEQWIDQPLRWAKPRMIFVCAHGDLFHEDVPDEWVDRVFAVMALAPHHTFQVLTKRADRMRAYVSGIQSKIPFLGRMPLERIHLEAAGHMEGDGGFMDVLKDHGNVYSLYLDAPWPLSNVWLGVSVEDQFRADQRRTTMAALADMGWLTWVSYEPALGPVDWKGWASVRWIVSGGESGDRARPTHPEWHRATRDFCAARGIAFLFKQWGAWAPYDYQNIGRAPGTRWRGNAAIDITGTRVDAKRWAEPGVMTFHLVGKAATGRLLDGVEYNGMPKA